MFKKVIHSKCMSFILDAIGIFSLASLILLWIYLRFIVDLLPSCYFTDALIVYVECGKGFIGESLRTYFQYFSPLITWIVPLLGYGFVTSLAHLELKASLISLIYLVGVLLVIITSFRLSWRIAQRLFWRRKEYDQKQRYSAIILTLIILSPTLIATGFKYYLIPPSSSDRIIAVDMWHSQLHLPRHYLEDWSLVDIEKPTKIQSNWEHFNSRGKDSPFVRLYMSFHEIDGSLSENDKFLIDIRPKPTTQTEDGLFQKREDYLTEIRAKKYRKKDEGYKVEHLLYSPPQIDKDWEVYRSAVEATGYDPDVYVHRNTQGKIENILRCVPRNYCAVKYKEKSWSMPKCKTEEECLNCTRMCQEASFGNTEYVVHYSFDKKYLDTYLNRHQKILNFIDVHSTSKP